MQGSAASTTVDICENITMDNKEILILVVGTPRSGKSSVCNDLLGEQQATVHGGILGHTTDIEEFSTTKRKFRLRVIDTPSVPTGFSVSAAWKHLTKWHKLFDLNPDVVLHVVPMDVVYTPEDFASYNITRLLLQNQVTDNVVLALTHGEDLQDGDMENIKKYNQALFEDACGRYVVFYGDCREAKPDYFQQIVQTGVLKNRRAPPSGFWYSPRGIKRWLTNVRRLSVTQAIWWSVTSLVLLRPKTVGFGVAAFVLFFLTYTLDLWPLGQGLTEPTGYGHGQGVSEAIAKAREISNPLKGGGNETL